jgi:hypothetical protein
MVSEMYFLYWMSVFSIFQAPWMDCADKKEKENKNRKVSNEIHKCFMTMSFRCSIMIVS